MIGGSLSGMGQTWQSDTWTNENYEESAEAEIYAVKGDKCNKCGRAGHCARDCQTDMSTVKCFKCGEKGHIGANCSKTKGPARRQMRRQSLKRVRKDQKGLKGKAKGKVRKVS